MMPVSRYSEPGILTAGRGGQVWSRKDTNPPYPARMSIAGLSPSEKKWIGVLCTQSYVAIPTLLS